MSDRGYTVRLARRVELSDVLRVQRHAFSRVAREAGIDPDRLEPLCESLDELCRLFDDGTVFIVAVNDHDRVVGSVRGALDARVVMVNRLVVEDGWERRGMGSALMDALEQELSEARVFRLFTGALATGPLALYHARGYRTVGLEDVGHFELAWLEKPGPNAVS